MLNLKNSGIEHPGYLGAMKKQKSITRRVRRRTGNPDQRHTKDFQQNHRGRFPQSKEGGAYQDMRSLWNTK